MGGGSSGETAAVEAVDLVKRFDEFVAVDSIDVRVEPGEYFGFLGPNGAGKTSTMRMIGCVSPPSSGSLRVLGHDTSTDGPAIRDRLGVVPQLDTLDAELPVWDNLVIYGRYFGLPRDRLERRAAELLDFVQLTDRRDDRVDPLSGGMKRRLSIARALMNDPDLVLLDEPTTGLDPQARHLVWERLFELHNQGTTMILTTHYMDEAEQLCDRLVIMDQARIAAEGTPAELIAEHASREIVELRFRDPVARGRAHGLLTSTATPAARSRRTREIADPGVLDSEETNGDRATAARAAERDRLDLHVELLAERVVVGTSDGDATVGWLHDHGVEPTTTVVRRATLEDVFLNLTGRTLVE